MSTLQRIRLGDLAAQLGCELKGDGEIEITGVAGLEQAGPGELTFLANPKYAPKVKEHARGGDSGRRSRCPTRQPASLISANPYLDFARALALFYQPPRPKPGIHPQAAIAATAQIGEGASIGAFVVVGEHVRHRQERRPASARGDLRRRRDRRRFLRALARRGARVLPDRQSRDPAKRRGGGRRRLRFRQDARGNALQDRAVRA